MIAKRKVIRMKVRKRLPENGFRDVRNLTLGREVLVHRFTPCYRDDWRPRIPDKGVLEAVDPKGRWALVRFTVTGGSYLECFFPEEILKVG